MLLVVGERLHLFSSPLVFSFNAAFDRLTYLVRGDRKKNVLSGSVRAVEWASYHDSTKWKFQ